MPFVSDRQRRWMFANEPEMAEQWAHHKAAPVPQLATSFDMLRARGLVGISDRVVRDHLELYARYCAELTALDAVIARPTLAAPAGMEMALVNEVLGRRVRDLQLDGSGKLAEVLEQLKSEFVMKGITWFPTFYLGEPDFWCADQAISVNVPWYLGSDVVWDLVNDQDQRYTPDEVLRILRHEAGHALGYAFELWRRPEWRQAFGDFRAPYADEFEIDPASTDYVRHLHVLESSPNAHYAQKHPDEDWAETFAVWLDPGSRWRETYADWPGALAKLEAIQLMVVGEGAAYGPPENVRPGTRVPYTTLDYTVAEYLGQAAPGGVDPRAEAMRRAPEVYSATVLHELYFGGLARGAGVLGPAPRFAELAGPDWVADLRAAAQASGVGWVVTVWDRRGARVRNVLVAGHDRGLPPGDPVLLALDLHEHSYAGDVGIRKDLYVAAWWQNVDWAVVGARLDAAVPPPAIAIPSVMAAQI